MNKGKYLKLIFNLKKIKVKKSDLTSDKKLIITGVEEVTQKYELA